MSEPTPVPATEPAAPPPAAEPAAAPEPTVAPAADPAPIAAADPTPASAPEPAVAVADPPPAATPAPSSTAPTVVVAQEQPVDDKWENGLCSHICGGDFMTCLGSWFCHPCLYGRVSGHLDKFPAQGKPETFNPHFWSFCGLVALNGCCPCFPGMAVHATMRKREQVRNRFGIAGKIWKDCLASWFCGPCTMAQMNTELKQRAAEEKAKQEKAKESAQPQLQAPMAYAPPSDPAPAPAVAPADTPAPAPEPAPPAADEKPPSAPDAAPPAADEKPPTVDSPAPVPNEKA